MVAQGFPLTKKIEKAPLDCLDSRDVILAKNLKVWM
jgi:hypothetical protein